jgi:GAF domain-containing protein
VTLPSSRVLEEIVNAAVEVTAASVGWILMIQGDDLVVVAAAGGESPGSKVGRRIPVSGTAGLVAMSGHPAAIESPPGDTSNVGAGGLDGNPAGVLASPCGDEDVLGVLEVARPEGSAPFTFDDVEEVTLLARIAGAALDELDEAGAAVPSASHLGAELTELAARNPGRYAAIARMIDAVLGQG